MTLEMIREVEAAREQAMEAQDSPANQTVKAVCNFGVLANNFSAVLAKEVFYRTSASHQRHSKAAGWIATAGSNRAGNSRARKTMVPTRLAMVALSAGERPGAMVARTPRSLTIEAQAAARRYAHDLDPIIGRDGRSGDTRPSA